MDASLDAERAHGAPLPHQPEIYYKLRMLHCIPVDIKGSCTKIDIYRKEVAMPNILHRSEMRIECTGIRNINNLGFNIKDGNTLRLKEVNFTGQNNGQLTVGEIICENCRF